MEEEKMSCCSPDRQVQECQHSTNTRNTWNPQLRTDQSVRMGSGLLLLIFRAWVKICQDDRLRCHLKMTNMRIMLLSLNRGTRKKLLGALCIKTSLKKQVGTKANALLSSVTLLRCYEKILNSNNVNILAALRKWLNPSRPLSVLPFSSACVLFLFNCNYYTNINSYVYIWVYLVLHILMCALGRTLGIW